MKEAVHLIRLAALFIIGFVLFLVVRQWIVPAGFGKYGHFRAGALDDVRARPISFAGRATCEGCHNDVRAQLAGGKHAHVNCEACHGPQARHAEDFEKVKPVLPDTKLLCPVCHEANTAKPKWFPQVVSQEHSGGEACKTCHQPHSPAIPKEGAK
jgi:hypothetical protein